MSFCSPLRYPGGKDRLSPFVKGIIKENNLLGTCYIEPYAGGAAMALKLLFEGYVSRIIINDLDRSIYAFWHSAVHRTDELCEKIQTTTINILNWEKAKKMQARKHDADLFELGFSTFFLNRTNISGVIKAGVIGGLEQRGRYKMSDRFNKDALMARIQKIGRFRDYIKVTNLDALDLLRRNNKTRRKFFVYLDPPYVKKAKDLYINSYRDNDHRVLAEFIRKNLSGNICWVTSYDKNNFILDMYKFCSQKFNWSNSYGTSNTKGGEEVIFVDERLKVRTSRKHL